LAVAGVVRSEPAEKKPKSAKEPEEKQISARYAVGGIRHLLRKTNWSGLDATEKNGFEIHRDASSGYCDSPLKRRLYKLAVKLDNLPSYMELGQNALMIMAIYGNNASAAGRLTGERAVKEVLRHGNAECALAALNNWAKINELGALQTLEFVATNQVNNEIDVNSYIVQLNKGELKQCISTEADTWIGRRIPVLATSRLMDAILADGKGGRLSEEEFDALVLGCKCTASFNFGSPLRELIAKIEKLPNAVDALLLLDSTPRGCDPDSNSHLAGAIASMTGSLDVQEAIFLIKKVNDLKSSVLKARLMERQGALQIGGSIAVSEVAPKADIETH
jgi:hypothetical protein